MLDKNQRKRIIKFINEKLDLVPDIDYFRFSSNGESAEEDYVLDKITDARIFMNATWSNFGASKSVFYFNEFPNYVFKIPFEGFISSYWDEYEEDYVINEDEPEYFYNAGDDNKRCWDYCETEAKVYIEAEKAGLKDFFAETEFLCFYNDYPIYISKYVKSDISHDSWKCDENTDSFKKASTVREKYGYNIYQEDVAIFIEQYGLDMTIKLVQFINKMNLHDFHDENLAYDKDGKLKLIDYSDFND